MVSSRVQEAEHAASAAVVGGSLFAFVANLVCNIA